MRAKTLLTALLGIFVVIALVVVAKDAKGPAPVAPKAIVASAVPAAQEPAPVASAPDPSPVQSVDLTSTVPPAPESRQKENSHVAESRTAPIPSPKPQALTPVPPTHARKVVATYFHGNVRCVTCRKVEAYAREAVEDGFGGSVDFRTVNVDEPENRHFIEDFQLTNKSVVVAEEIDGKVARWVKLDEVWSLVNDRTAYYKYVQGAVGSFVETQ